MIYESCAQLLSVEIISARTQSDCLLLLTEMMGSGLLYEGNWISATAVFVMLSIFKKYILLLSFSLIFRVIVCSYYNIPILKKVCELEVGDLFNNLLN